MSRLLEHKIAIVTGASRGIEAATASNHERILEATQMTLIQLIRIVRWLQSVDDPPTRSDDDAQC
jgi:NADP-dependent 3-hydroxy acid dehydrogenase YdfG